MPVSTPQSLTVLIIDDEHFVRESLAIYFEDLGYHVLQAGNGLEGLDICRNTPPDIVYTDLRMPVLDGFGVAETLAVEFPELPVVVISGVGNIEEAIQAIHLGAWDYITKPIEDLELIEITTRQLLERAHLMRENREYRQKLELLVEERTSQLAESEERFRQLFLQHDDAIVLCTSDSFSIIEMNPAGCQLFGTIHPASPGLSASRLFQDREWHDIRIKLEQLHDREFMFHDLLSAIAIDGSPLTISFKGWRVTIGNRPYYYFSMRDMKEKVALEQEVRASQSRLIHANKMTSLGILISGMAHEINNPNNFISVNAGILGDIWRDAGPLLREAADNGPDYTLGGFDINSAIENAAQLIAGIERGSSRINTVVNGLKNFARADTSDTSGTFSIAEALNDARMILDHQIQSRTDAFSVHCPDNLPAVRGSHQQIEQVVINLLVNALQALPERTHGIEVAATYTAEDDMVVVSITDQGIGMPPEVCSHIMEPFYTTRLNEGGTGLGLSICSSIIRDHNGTITFDSRPGAGTRVTVRLPAATGQTP